MNFPPVIMLLYGRSNLKIGKLSGWAQPNQMSSLNVENFLWLVEEGEV